LDPGPNDPVLEHEVAYLVRHAHAGSKRTWIGPDALRPLSEVGHAQAIGLVDRLRSWPVTRILSSPTARCLQTVAPLVAERGLEPEPVETLAVDGDARRVLRMLVDPALEAAVLCTHGEVIGEALEHAGEAGLRLLDPPRWDKGSIWIVEGGDGRPLEARYVAPARPPATWSRR
jgi:broad specificity phosphatase PhoE